MEGTLIKAHNNIWYVCNIKYKHLLQVYPKEIKGYLLQDEDEGKEVYYNVITTLVYDNIRHRSIEVPKYAQLTKKNNQKYI